MSKLLTPPPNPRQGETAVLKKDFDMALAQQ